MKWPAYPKYKDSGIEWLGQVPEGWGVMQLKWAIMFQRGHDLPADEREDGRVPLVTSAGVSATHSRAAAKGPGIVTGRYGTIGVFHLVEQDYWPLNTTLYSISLRGNHPPFLRYMLTHLNPLFMLNAIKSAVPGIDRNDVHSVESGIPPLPEQHAIASFLDRETGRIDLLVSKKRTLIERLKEKRTALISRTVTRGLPPAAARAAGLPENPTLKPSGIEWLGEVPEGWEVMQLKWAIMFQRGHDLPADEREDGSVPLVTSAGVAATHSRAAAKGPGIVTGRYGTIGIFHLVQQDYWPLNTTLYSISLRGNYPPFLRYMLTHLNPLFMLNAIKSAVPGIDRNDIHSVESCVPPLPEQRAIAAFLDAETAKLDALVAKVETAIERLLEYRTALITAAVTGKIDVRGAIQ